MKATGFETKLLRKLGKLDADQLQPFLEQILEQKQFLLGILDRLNEGVIVTDAGLDLLFANPKARSMLGMPRRRGQQSENLIALIPKDNPLAGIIGSLRGNLREIDAYESPYGRQKDRYVALTTLLMRSSGAVEGAPAGTPKTERTLLMILLQDVTERRLRLDEQARARRLASMATLTSGIAHEVKNPLNSLNIHAQLLQNEADLAAEQGRPPSAERVQRASRVILEETRRMGRILDDFIAAARPRQPDLAEGALGTFLERVAGLFDEECRQAGVALMVNIEPDLPSIYFDEHLLMQALRNLVRNALDALAEHLTQARAAQGGYTPTLEISAVLAGDAINLSVADNGPGIDPKTLEHIFEPYYTTKFHGSGLGLMVVYRIVTEHKASLHVDTQPGAGTRFTILLPVHQKPVRLLERGEAPVDDEENGSALERDIGGGEEE